MRSMLTLMLFAALAGPALASDGVLEINQTCAVNAGCFPGDDPGFPVTVVQPGSYRLTSSLDLSAEGVNVSGVSVSAPAVTIDMRGFQIAGPTSCTGSGTAINCSPSSTGVGSAGVRFTIDATAGVVRNGIVHNMTNFGILSQATGLRVQDITAIHNGRDGITGGQGALVVNSVAVENGQDGIDVNTGSVVDGVTSIGNGSNGIRGQGTASVVTRTSVRNNGMRGFFLGLSYKFGKDNVSSANDQGDSCGGGICTERRRIYLTKDFYPANAVLSACGFDFHLASQTELQSLGSYVYDYVLGRVTSKSGTGPPSRADGWVRSGLDFSTQTSDCAGWTSTASGEAGVAVNVEGVLQGSGEFQFDSVTARFNSRYYACPSQIRVWCLEGPDADTGA